MGLTAGIAQGSSTGASTSFSIGINVGVVTGQSIYVIVISGTANAHSGPAGWTKLLGVAGEGGYVSVWTRVRQAGDSNSLTFTNGGISTSWAISYVAMTSSVVGGGAGSAPDSQSLVNPSGTAITVPALADAATEQATQLILLSCIGNSVTSAVGTLVLGGATPAIYQRIYPSTKGVPAETGFVRSAAVPTVVYSLLLTDGGSLGARAIRSETFAWLKPSGYNTYVRLQRDYGGSIQVI